MVKRKRILTLICMICMLTGIVLSGSFSAAETGDAHTLVFVNDYASEGSYTWDVTKTVEGHPLQEDEQFSFTIEAADNAPLPLDSDGRPITSYTLKVTAEEAGSNSVTRSLPVIPFTNKDLNEAGSGTFKYRITEDAGNDEFMTYDSVPKTLTLNAVDQKDGTITVTRVSDDSGDKTIFTNARICSAVVTKTWEDKDDERGLRPANITALLYANNQPTGLAVKLGTEPAFTNEGDPDLYGSVVYEGDSAGTAVTDGNSFTATLKNLPESVNGTLQDYTWLESDSVMYYADPVYDNSTAGTTAILNKILPLGTLKVTKKMTVDDGKIQIEGRSFEFTVTRKAADGTTEYLTPDGKAGTEQTAVSIMDGETVTFENLLLGTYQVTELGTENGGSAQVENYTLTVKADNDGAAVLDTDGGEVEILLTNTYTRKRGSLTITKKVTGVNDGDKAGQTYRVRVKDSDGEYYLTDGTAAAADKAWTTVTENSPAVWTNLPYGSYTAEEDLESAAIARYSIDEEQSVVTAEALLNDANGGKDSKELRNVYLPMLGNLEITKEITGTDATSEFGKLRFRITGPDGFSRTVTYDMFTDGKYTAEELPDGEYTIEEINADEIAERLILRADSVTTAKATVTAGATTAVKLVNNYDIVTTSVTVRKVWDDRNNQDGMRPKSIVMTLSNGMKAELNAQNGWTATIDNLPMYDQAGNFINYKWTEPRIAGYTQQSVTTEGSETEFVNKHTPETVSATVTKIWDDADNAAGLRPANLRVTLSNGSTYYLNEKNGWTITVEGLPAYKDGVEIVYTWSEQSVLGYTSTVKTDENGTTFTNHFYGETTTGDTHRRVIRLQDNSLIIIEDPPTALGLGGIINHVGDTFE